MRWGILGIAMLGLAACASSSGVATTGPNAYKITTSAITSFGGAATAKAEAYKSAEAHCAKEGKKSVVTQDGSTATIASGSADVSFRCE